MELFEFAVMILQAPAQSVTQSVIYAKQNQVARGMYLNHALFLTSIVFSIVDMLISIFKLMRWGRERARGEPAVPAGGGEEGSWDEQ
jgi:hypothetical protein